MAKQKKILKKTDKSKIPVIILCGGMGARLKEETEFKPKPMIEVGGKPILWHVMKIYAHYGYRNFILALGYKGNYIKDYFLQQRYYTSDFSLSLKNNQTPNIFYNNHEKDDFNIIFSDTGLETPHGERILRLKRYIDTDLFMVTYGDGVADIDIDKLVEFHKKQGLIATITGAHPISRWGMIAVNKSNLITQYDQKPFLYDYINGGFMVFNKKILKFLKPGDMIEDVFPRLISRKQLGLYRHEGFWYGMDTYRDFLFLNDLWEKDPKWKIWT